MTGDVQRLLEFVQHTSWRCEHPPHFYLTDDARQARVAGGDCACGLISTLREIGVDPGPWIPREQPS